MTEIELKTLVEKIILLKCETPNIELKKAKSGCPESLYDTLSSFSNTSGGVIIFGIDEKNNYSISGVDDPQALQKNLTQQCSLMEPIVRPLITITKIGGKTVCSAEIPEMDVFLKPCYYQGKGKIKGSYTRIGDADLPMTDYEIHSYDSFKYKTEDELRSKERIDYSYLSQNLIDSYISKLLMRKSNLVNVSKEKILELEGIISTNKLPTLCGVLNFASFPQAFSPSLNILAVRCATDNYAEENSDGIRFLDNKRIDGTIFTMLQQGISFILNNTKKSTFINPQTGLREDKTEYPIKAIREVLLNALIHRDYSRFTENDPIRIEIYDNRIEVTNPGGLYGRLKIQDLGTIRSDIRNPFIASILETMEVTENRYSGIPTIYNEMKKAGLKEPKFEDIRGVFKVTLYNEKPKIAFQNDLSSKIIETCVEPQTKEYLAELFGFDSKHPAYFFNTYIKPLIQDGFLKYTIPDKPKSKYQRIVSV